MTRPSAPPRRGIDEDWDKVPAPALKVAGYSFVIGYLSEDTTGKNITKTEIDDYLRNGLDVVLVYEFAPDQPLRGAQQGYDDADKMCDWAIEVGAPTNIALYTALDRNFASSTYETIADYVSAWTSVCHSRVFRSGVYGSIDVIGMILNAHVADFGWQTYAWSGGRWDDRAVIRQTENGTHVAGHTVDLDSGYGVDFGQWKATSPGVPIGAFMSLTDDLIQGWAEGTPNLSDGSENLLTTRQVRMDTFMSDVRASLSNIASQANSNGSSLTVVMTALGQIRDALKTIQDSAGATGPEQALLDVWGRMADALDAIHTEVAALNSAQAAPPEPVSAPQAPVQPDSLP